MLLLFVHPSARMNTVTRQHGHDAGIIKREGEGDRMQKKEYKEHERERGGERGIQRRCVNATKSRVNRKREEGRKEGRNDLHCIKAAARSQMSHSSSKEPKEPQ
jgi:hypothetical protein